MTQEIVAPCHYCGKGPTEHSELLGYDVCEDCRSERTFECAECGDEEIIDNGVQVDRNMWCSGCTESDAISCRQCEGFTERNNAYECENCNALMHENCYRNHPDDCEGEGEISYRDYQSKPIRAEKNGNIITSPRLFGVEIECFAEDMSSLGKATREIPREVGVGDDGSISADYGVEFKTPPAQKKAGEDLIRKVCKILNQNGFDVNKSCGLHIHLSGEGYEAPGGNHSDSSNLRKLWATYYAIEDILLAMLPVSRRGNYYCESLRRGYSLDEILAYSQGDQEMEHDLEKVWYRFNSRERVQQVKRSKSHDSRYRGLNLHSFLASGHFEVRFHSGTINPEKILNWIALHQYLIDNAPSRFNREVLEQIVSTPFLEQKIELFFAQYRLPKFLQAYILKRVKHFQANARRMKYRALVETEDESKCAA